MNRRLLTARERAVAELVSRGRTNAQIAEALGVSLATVKRYLNTIMIKWNCENRTQVAVRAFAARLEGHLDTVEGDEDELID